MSREDHAKTTAEVQEKAQQQAEALAGKQGGLLWAVAKDDGKRLAEHKLNGPPVFDGMAAARGRLYVCTMDGAVHCLGVRESGPAEREDE